MRKRKNFLPVKRQWPKYTIEQQELLFQFLGAYKLEAELMVERLMQNQRLAPGEPAVENILLFWKNAVGCLNWLGSRVKHRQKHLAILAELKRLEQEGSPCSRTSD